MMLTGGLVFGAAPLNKVSITFACFFLPNSRTAHRCPYVWTQLGVFHISFESLRMTECISSQGPQPTPNVQNMSTAALAATSAAASRASTASIMRMRSIQCLHILLSASSTRCSNQPSQHQKMYRTEYKTNRCIESQKSKNQKTLRKDDSNLDQKTMKQRGMLKLDRIVLKL